MEHDFTCPICGKFGCLEAATDRLYCVNKDCFLFEQRLDRRAWEGLKTIKSDFSLDIDRAIDDLTKALHTEYIPLVPSLGDRRYTKQGKYLHPELFETHEVGNA